MNECKVLSALGCAMALSIGCVVVGSALPEADLAQAVQPIFSPPAEWVPLEAEIPQGRLFCGEGSLAYRKLLPARMQRISRGEVLLAAKEGATEACEHAWRTSGCKEAEERVATLRRVVSECE